MSVNKANADRTSHEVQQPAVETIKKDQVQPPDPNKPADDRTDYERLTLGEQ